MPRPTRANQLQEPVVCSIDVVDIGRVRVARAALPDASTTAALAALFGALADPTRVRIVAALASAELCVSDLAATIGLTPSAASHHLRLLRELGLVRTRREGRCVYYALDDVHVQQIVSQALDHVGHGLEGGDQ